MTTGLPEKEKENKKARSILTYSGLGLQSALIIGGGTWFGSWLDDQYPMEKKWFTLLMVLISVSVAMAYTIKRINKLNK